METPEKNNPNDIDRIYDQFNKELDEANRISDIKKRGMVDMFYQDGEKYLSEIEKKTAEQKPSKIRQLLQFLMNW